jgi:hypothetical protein
MNMPENGSMVTDRPELHSFVKLAIAYLWIMDGLAVLGLGFYIVAAQAESLGDSLVPADRYYVVIAFYSVLICLSLEGWGDWSEENGMAHTSRSLA